MKELAPVVVGTIVLCYDDGVISIADVVVVDIVVISVATDDIVVVDIVVVV